MEFGAPGTVRPYNVCQRETNLESRILDPLYFEVTRKFLLKIGPNLNQVQMKPSIAKNVLIEFVRISHLAHFFHCL